MNNSHILGRPEWGQADDDDAAAAMPHVDVASEAGVIRAEWAAAARRYWVAAQEALVAAEYPSMRVNAKIASEAEAAASPNGALMAAIFGGAEIRPADNVVQAGLGITAQAALDAKAAVNAEINRHGSAKQHAERAAWSAKQSAERADWSAKQDAAFTNAASAAFSVGEVYTASVPYKLAKKSAGLCYVGGVLVSVPACRDGCKIRITTMKRGTFYGLRYLGEGVVE